MRRGLTLIESLVAIAIISILVATLVPGVGLVRARAREGECRSHLRELALGALGYSNSNREWLPPAILFFMKDGQLDARGWDYRQFAGAWSPGAIWPFIGDGRVLMSPELAEPASDAEPFTGYNYNTTHLGSEGFLPGPAPDGHMIEGWENARLGAAPAQVRRPSDCALFGEGGWKGGANRFMRAPLNSVEYNLGTIYAGGQAFRRGRGTLVVHLDGNVRAYETPHEGPYAAPWLLSQVMGFPRNGFLSADDSAYDPR
ncbi:MAG: type II secretion system protein [Phycisphaerae bacterium]|nr:type II secretion system protein [Phycisphaerae bacterium]